MKGYRYYLLLCLFCIFIQCTSNRNQNIEQKNFLDADNSKIKEGKNFNSKDWKCELIGNENICIPSTWKPRNQDKYLYYCDLNNSNTNTYFLIIKYNTKTQNINFTRYLKESYSQLINDTIEIGEGYTVKRLIFKDKDTFHCEYYTKKDNTQYLTYSMLFIHYNFLYDISLKVERDSSGKYYNAFRDILLNFEIEGKSVFSSEEKIKKIQIVDLSKLQ